MHTQHLGKLQKNLLMLLLCCVLFCVTHLPSIANADAITLELKIKNHQFEPQTITAPAGEVIKLKVVNLDDTVEEFESLSLNREKIIPSGGTITVTVGPLSPGEYDFFGEFHQATAQGKLMVK